jgi:hypothetical protein
MPTDQQHRDAAQAFAVALLQSAQDFRALAATATQHAIRIDAVLAHVDKNLEG